MKIIDVPVTRYHAGNLAIEQDHFEIPLDLAKALNRYLKRENNTFDQQYFRVNAKIRAAMKGGKQSITVRTAGFSTADLWNLLYNAAPSGWKIACTTTIDERTDQRKEK